MIEEIRELKIIAECNQSLKDKGIVRSYNIVGDLGEYYCKQYFDIKLNENKIKGGFDGVDNSDNKVEIKTRRTPKNNAVIYFRNILFEYLIYVELDANFKPVLVLKINKSEVVKHLNTKRKSITINQIKNKLTSSKLL
jgi:hypothetical protein|tara:strand:+ start:6065 stop:6478 length:414 start_codon:yes stop_codon:yes gene_type:complete